MTAAVVGDALVYTYNTYDDAVCTNPDSNEVTISDDC